MAKIKSYTDIEQSKKLTKILPIDTADMYHFIDNIDKVYNVGFGYRKVTADYYSKTKLEYIPCWSLASLLDVLPEWTRLLKSTNISSVGDIKYRCDCLKINVDKWFDNPVDACVAIVEHLHELNLL